MQQLSTTVEAVLAEMAGRTHGVVTRAQLLAAGITPEALRQRLRRGALIRAHPGVYRVGHRAHSVEATFLAAVWACGEGAVLAVARRRTSRAHQGPTAGPRSDRAHEAARRRRHDPTPRLIDAARPPPTAASRSPPSHAPSSTSRPSLPRCPARACHKAGVLYGTTPQQVEAILAKRPRTKGAAKLHAVLHGDVHVTLASSSARFWSDCDKAELPLPKTNKPAHGRRVDCRWPDRRLTVELDSYRYHRSRHAWEQDRRREREARARGDEFRRYTWGDVFERPRLMLAELRELLP